MTKLEVFKSSFHQTEKQIPFNNAGMSPLTRPAFEGVRHWAQRLFEEADLCAGDAMAAVELTRTRVAQFLGAASDEVIFFSSTAAAISQIAFGLKLAPGDEILTWDQEYPSNFYPWQRAAERAGAKLIVVRSCDSLATPAEALLARITPRTKVIATSWVQYRSGAIVDLNKITAAARPAGIFTCADIIQGAGARPFNFAESGVDAACGGGHKWLASPLGVGLLLLRKEHFMEVEPLAVGAMSYGTWDSLSDVKARIKTTGERFEPGAKNILDLIALGCSVDLFQRTGVEVIATEAARLTLAMVHGLERLGYVVHSPHGPSFHGAILNFTGSAKSKYQSVEEITAALTAARVTFGVRPPGVRLSLHAFNTDAQVTRALAIL